MAAASPFLRPLILSAIRGAEALPATARADVYRGIAEVTKRRDPAMCSHATDLAQAIEDAEALQLYFTGLLTEKDHE